MTDPRAVSPQASELTLEEQAALVTGGSFWATQPVERLGISPIVLTDGPHGVRLQSGQADHLGINDSLPATPFPTASATGSSWDPALLAEIGAAGVAGVQSEGVGASVKHFAANNRETNRMRVSAEVDARTLREIYLPAFETIVKTSKPATVMCAYNAINGVPSSRMYQGDIVESGSAADVTGQPEHPYTQRLPLAAPVADPLQQERRRAERMRLREPHDDQTVQRQAVI